MATAISDTLPDATIFAYLTDDGLQSVDSYPDASIYWYACGCNVVRQVEFPNCYVRWCAKHCKPHGTYNVCPAVAK